MQRHKIKHSDPKVSWFEHVRISVPHSILSFSSSLLPYMMFPNHFTYVISIVINQHIFKYYPQIFTTWHRLMDYTLFIKVMECDSQFDIQPNYKIYKLLNRVLDIIDHQLPISSNIYTLIVKSNWANSIVSPHTLN